jgi:hypothetical protein
VPPPEPEEPVDPLEPVLEPEPELEPELDDPEPLIEVPVPVERGVAVLFPLPGSFSV